MTPFDRALGIVTEFEAAGETSAARMLLLTRIEDLCRALEETPAPHPGQTVKVKAPADEGIAGLVMCHECGVGLKAADAQYSGDGSCFCPDHRISTPPRHVNGEG
ncbi:hypothetical protein [Xanthobacter aminoxidans]|uniref:hypothetical protein n=1 Tax=Xanthobacter aminoxidans TaxID=186280 RepID=UPI0037272ACC